jgi:hypothetical protein
MARSDWRLWLALIVAFLGSGLVPRISSAADKTAKKIEKLPAPPVPASALLTPEAWQETPLTTATAEEIDRLILAQLKAQKIAPTPLTTDEQFVRRLSLDLTGRLPSPAEIEAFVRDKASDKRSKLIDSLLDSEVYARHWARYWRDTVLGDQPLGVHYQLEGDFEDWLCEQFKTNQPWDVIVTAMLTAEGTLKRGEGKNGAIFFLGRVDGEDGQIARTNDTARLFLGIQVQCAQCHDANRGGKPSQWQRTQFHELAGFFARLGGGNSFKTATQIKLFALKPKLEREMPDKNDPGKHYVTTPRFLTGATPTANADDLERRQALARFVTDKKNFWFAAAYANRVWGEFLGQSFYEKVDEMGPNRKDDALMLPVLVRLTAAFRATDYDTRALARLVLNTQAYQRQSRMGQSADEPISFAAVYPTRLRADVVRQSLESVLGTWKGPQTITGKDLEQVFYFDPSSKVAEIQGSLSQALWLMNSNLVNTPIRAKGPAPAKEAQDIPLLQQILSAHAQDDDAIRALYLRVLARKPTERELQTCREHLQATLEAKGKRSDAFEDLLWVLVNSTEFLRKR